MIIRSLLFVPGNNEKVIAKAEQLPADVIIYDLEDAVAPEQKAEARARVCKALAASRKSVVVRINSMETPYFVEDVRAIAELSTDALKGIMLPKSNRGSDVIMLERMLDSLDVLESVEIIPLLESASGVYHSFEIADSSKRVKRLAFGSVDFALDIGATLTKEGTELLFARSQLVVASRVAGLEQPIDTVYVDFKDSEGLVKEAAMVKGLGFGGKLAIHPSQLEGINRTFQSSEAEIQEAEEIMAHVREYGASVFQLNGKMVDEPIIQRAKRVLELAGKLNLGE
ncbi:HpcH/HpaI aldolase/citrate lyase family protein [Sporosarcina cyprini]|uniref:HpcH/HpaI aldolase/citrate lyase family protein n=1 Tax=Sporosarcina cyprini TaxID=2910523 RepID=UPI001EDD3001|nr:CoA ester lyase [Sporosarcina cyprini]MCG3088225.1 CoA ester lyase [Sporosarcina cyprini]